jgi:S-adenosylmethionine-diacylgycerolhomoserine-N-methlytransferase
MTLGEADSHAALMDGVYRRQRHVYDFTRKYYLFGRDRLIQGLALQPGESLLEIGCGTARNLIRVARLYPQAELYGLDTSAGMLETAARSVAGAGLGSRIHLAQGRAEQLEPGLFSRNHPFDHAVFSYSLSMIPQWRQALSAAGRALRETGTVHVVDFGDFAGLPQPLGSLLRAWLGRFHVEPRIELLHGMESRSLGGGLENSDFWILPGRYAFGWSGGVKGVMNHSQ